MKNLFKLIGLSTVLALSSGCSEMSALAFKNNTTNADTIVFADPALQACWDDALALVKQTTLPVAPFIFHSVSQVTVLGCDSYGIVDASDISNASGALSIDLSNNNIGSLELGYMPFLDDMFAIFSGISTVNVAGAAGLQTLDLGYNAGITSLDLTANIELQQVDLTLSNITDAVISNKQDLWFISLAATPLVTLDISGNPSLQVVSLVDADRVLDAASLLALDTLDATTPGLCIYIYPYEDTDCTALDLTYDGL